VRRRAANKIKTGRCHMALIEWDDSFSVNVREIDLQHQKLVGMLNDFDEHLRQHPTQAFQALLDSLVEYTQYHFATEEKYFSKFSYPDARAHIEEHRTFTEKVLNVRSSFNKRGELLLFFEITNFLKDWLTTHIKGSDKAYAKCFNDNGLF
jgi:hemerythrin